MYMYDTSGISGRMKGEWMCMKIQNKHQWMMMKGQETMTKQ